LFDSVGGTRREPSNPLNTGNRDYDQSVKLTLKAAQCGAEGSRR
jgi:hypothetical protein